MNSHLFCALVYCMLSWYQQGLLVLTFCWACFEVLGAWHAWMPQLCISVLQLQAVPLPWCVLFSRCCCTQREVASCSEGLPAAFQVASCSIRWDLLVGPKCPAVQQQDRVYTLVAVLMQPRLTLPFSAALIHVLINRRLDLRQVGAAGPAGTVWGGSCV